jgi:hypothetical protein
MSTVIKNIDKIMLIVILLFQLYTMTGGDFRTNSTVIKDLQAEVVRNRQAFDDRNAYIDSTFVRYVRALAVGECLDRSYIEAAKMQLNCSQLFQDMGMTYTPRK